MSDVKPITSAARSYIRALGVNWNGTTLDNINMTVKDAVFAYEARVKELEAALDYYACVDHYMQENHTRAIIFDDCGARARAALGDAPRITEEAPAPPHKGE